MLGAGLGAPEEEQGLEQFLHCLLHVVGGVLVPDAGQDLGCVEIGGGQIEERGTSPFNAQRPSVLG